MNNLNLGNLVHIKNINKIGSETTTTIRLAMLNARSVKNKDQFIVEEFIENGIGMGLLTKNGLKIHPKTKLGSTSQTSNNQLLKYNKTTNQATRKVRNSINTPKEYQSQLN